MQTDVVYVASSTKAAIAGYSVDPRTGTLSPVNRVSVPGNPPPKVSLPIAIDRGRKLLLVAVRAEPWIIATFRIDPASGRLSLAGTSPLAGNMCYLSLDKSGRFLFSASFQGDKIAVNEIENDGRIAPAHQVIDTGPKSHCILPSPDNRFALSLCYGANRFDRWTFDERKGILSPAEPPAMNIQDGNAPRQFVFSPNGRFVYLLAEKSNTLHAYEYAGATGQLRSMQMAAATDPAAINHHDRIHASTLRISDSGRLLCAAERGTGVLSTFAVDEKNGSMKFIQHVVTEQNPWAFALSRDSRYLFAAGYESDRLATYSIHPETQRLQLTARTLVDDGVTWVEVL